MSELEKIKRFNGTLFTLTEMIMKHPELAENSESRLLWAGLSKQMEHFQKTGTMPKMDEVFDPVQYEMKLSREKSS